MVQTTSPLQETYFANFYQTTAAEAENNYGVVNSGARSEREIASASRGNDHAIDSKISKDQQYTW